MFGSLPAGGSPQEMFISPLENVTSVDSQNAYVSLAPANAFRQIVGDCGSASAGEEHNGEPRC